MNKKIKELEQKNIELKKKFEEVTVQKNNYKESLEERDEFIKQNETDAQELKIEFESVNRKYLAFKKNEGKFFFLFFITYFLQY